MKKSNTYIVNYTKRIGGQGTIIVRAHNEEQAIKNAKFLCFTGSDFNNPTLIDDSLYIKPSMQGFAGSHRQ